MLHNYYVKMEVRWVRNRWSVAGKLFTVNRVLHAGQWKTETQVWR